MIKPEQFSKDIACGTPAFLADRSFIIPVPAGCGQPMVYPEDAGQAPALQKGRPVLDRTGQPKGTGIVFKNYTDNAFQAVRDDGLGMIIVNGLSGVEAAQLFAFYNQRVPVPEKASSGDILAVLDYARSALGIEDFFNGNRAKIPDFEAEVVHDLSADCGVFIRRSAEERKAVLLKGSGAFMGPAATPQKFTHDVVLVGNGKHSWLVETAAFLKTYRHADNRAFSVADLPVVLLKAETSPAGLLATKTFWSFSK